LKPLGVAFWFSYESWFASEGVSDKAKSSVSAAKALAKINHEKQIHAPFEQSFGQTNFPHIDSRIGASFVCRPNWVQHPTSTDAIAG